MNKNKIFRGSVSQPKNMAGILEGSLLAGRWPIMNETEESVDIYIYGVIGDEWTDDPNAASTLVNALKSYKGKRLNVHINSYGGSVFDGIAMYNALKDHAGKVIAHIDAIAASSATIIACGADEVIMHTGALFMIHDPWVWAVGSADELRKNAAVLDKVRDQIAAIYLQKTGQKEAVIKDWMSVETWFDAEEAIAAGFVSKTTDEINPRVSNSWVYDDQYTAPKGANFLNDVKNLYMQNKEQIEMKRKLMESQQSAPQNSPTPAPAPIVAPAEPVDIQSAILAAIEADRAAESNRRQNITALFGKFEASTALNMLKDELLNDPSVTIEAAQRRLIDHVSTQSTASPILSGTTTVTLDSRDKTRNAKLDAMVARGNGTSRKIGENPYRGHSLIDLARDSLTQAGVTYAGRDTMEIVGLAFTHSTSDFPIILEEYSHRELMNGYNVIEHKVWDQICQISEVTDFREHKRFILGHLGLLEEVKEGAEYKHGAIPDGEQSGITAKTWGKIYSITRQAIINDDFDAIQKMFSNAGIGASLTVENVVLALLTSNPMVKGRRLFMDDNTVNAVEMAMTPLEQLYDKLTDQKAIGNEDLDLVNAPHLLLVAKGDKRKAKLLNNEEKLLIDGQESYNLVQGEVESIVWSPKIKKAAYVFANPVINPVLDIGFLNGQRDPVLETIKGWSVDGTQVKVRHDWGVGVVDYRGVAKLNMQ